MNKNWSSRNPSVPDEVPPSYEEATGIPTAKPFSDDTTIPIPVEPDSTTQNNNFFRMYSELMKYDPRAFVYTVCMMVTLLLITLLAAVRISRETTVIRSIDGPYYLDIYDPN